jgi:hypothetical protein
MTTAAAVVPEAKPNRPELNPNIPTPFGGSVSLAIVTESALEPTTPLVTG